MSRYFIKKITATFRSRRYRIALGDHLVLLCADGLRIEGELIAYCPEGINLACNRADVWVNSEAIAAVVRVKNDGGGGGGNGGGNGDAFSPAGHGISLRQPEPDADGNVEMEKVFCNGTR